MEAKKTKKADLSRKTGLFFHLGLLVSMGLMLAAFEHKSYKSFEIKDFEPMDSEFVEIIDIPITEQPPPPPPPVEQPEIEEVPDDVKIEEKIEVDFDVDVDEETEIKEIDIPDAPVISDQADEIFDVVESMPTPPGGKKGWNKFLRDNLKYPSQARRMGIEGTVYVEFVVNTDGSIQDVGILRGIGGGCNEEAIRVINNSPKWTPGKQRGRPVRVKMRLPIWFKLN